MRNILLAIDAVSPDNAAIAYACSLAALTQSKISAVLLENFIAEEKPRGRQMHGLMFVDWDIDAGSPEHKAKLSLIEKNIDSLKAECSQKNVRFHIIKKKGSPLTELLAETRFADILLVGRSMSFSNHHPDIPSGFLSRVLRKSECPVLITAEAFGKIEEIVFAFTDTESSFFAVRQFTYLFPELHTKKMVVVQANETGELDTGEIGKCQWWLSGYYTDIHFEVLGAMPARRCRNTWPAKKILFW